jgi:uncharacterized protein YdhG (YjbR/CyaY superfamily)
MAFGGVARPSQPSNLACVCAALLLTEFSGQRRVNSGKIVLNGSLVDAIKGGVYVIYSMAQISLLPLGKHGVVVKPKNIDEYLAALSDDKRAALERLRKIIRAAVPKAEECISYQLPAFRLDGKCFVWFGAAANHCAIYGVLGEHRAELRDYDISKGTIRFQADKVMPAALVRKLIKARLAKNAVRSNEAR